MYQPPNPKTYNVAVWEIVCEIPEGCVSTYGQIASMIPPPEGVAPDQYKRLSPRWVGSAMRATPAGRGVPWHRVINSQGKISLPAGSPGADEQRGRLEMEGVVFSPAGRVNLKKFGWDGPPADWLEQHNYLPPRSLKPKPPEDESQLPLL